MADVQFAVGVGDVAFDGGQTDEQLIGDFLVPHACGDETQDLELPYCELHDELGCLDRGSGDGLSLVLEGRQQSPGIGARDPVSGRVAKEVAHSFPFVHEDSAVAFRFGQGQSAFQRFESSRNAALRLVGKCLQHQDFDDASRPLTFFPAFRSRSSSPIASWMGRSAPSLLYLAMSTLARVICSNSRR